jgi:hypothetical protein
MVPSWQFKERERLNVRRCKRMCCGNGIVYAESGTVLRCPTDAMLRAEGRMVLRSALSLGGSACDTWINMLPTCISGLSFGMGSMRRSSGGGTSCAPGSPPTAPDAAPAHALVEHANCL